MTYCFKLRKCLQHSREPIVFSIMFKLNFYIVLNIIESKCKIFINVFFKPKNIVYLQICLCVFA